MSFFTRYRPLLVLILVSAIAGCAINYSNGSLMGWMHGFMGTALILFATLKLFDPVKFAQGFAKYDLIAGKSHGYGVVYPFLELGLGLAYLAHYNPQLTYVATIVLFGIGAIGVITALRRGLNINCACMGTVLNVPLSHVTLTEDLGMVAMAGFMLATL